MTTDPSDDAIEGELMALSMRDQFFDSNFSEDTLRQEQPKLSLEEAVALRDDIRRDWDVIQERAEIIRPKIYRLWLGMGWEALGYDSWRQCVLKEFPSSESHLYRELAAAKVEKILNSQETTSDNCKKSRPGEKSARSISEKVLRPLTTLLKDPAKLKETFEKVVKETGGKPTQKAMRKAVHEAKNQARTDRERYADYVRFLQRLKAQDLIIEKWGGILAYTRDWSEGEVRSLRTTLEQYRDQFQGWIDDMNEAGLICDIDISYSETFEEVDS